MKRRDDKFPDNGFEAWGGYMQAKIAKLVQQFDVNAGIEQNKLSDIFNGVSIYVNGYTTPSADELKTLMSKHGGIYHTYQKSNDYIIASNLPDTKVKNMSLAKVVRPEWIIDSITSNRLLDYRGYLLYKSSRTQSTLNFNKIDFKDVNNEDESLLTTLKGTHQTTATSAVNAIKVVNNITNISKSISNNSTHNEVDKKNYQMVKTAVDPNFISEFYNNSRLHHISQLGACFKQYINDLRENSNFQFPLRLELRQKIIALSNPNTLSQINFEGGKTIMHIDMDCFFVSVGLRIRPELRGKAVAVTHSKGGQIHSKRSGVDRNNEFNLYRLKEAKQLGKVSGIPEEIAFESRDDNITDEDDKYGSMSEIASCSYEARAKGISNGMFMGAALKLCPDLRTIPYDFEGYKEVAYTLYNTLAQYTLDIEAVSCDEMYVDCTELLKSMNVTVQDFATALREEIKTKTGCPCSTGFGGNRLQARLATKRAKPNGQFFLSTELVDDFMFDTKLKDLPGVGRQTAHKLETLGHQTCGSLQNLTLATLQHHLGCKTGTQLYGQCRGRDPNPLTYHTIRKSVSAEVNYGIRFENNDQCVEFLKQLSVEIHNRMRQFKVLGKCITLKLMVRAEEAPVETAKFMGHGFCNVINKSTSLNIATDDVNVITKEVILLCKKQKIDPKEMRGIGIQISKLESMTSYKQNKEGISKFLSNKSLKPENKCDNEVYNDIPEEQKQIISETVVKLKIPTTPKKNKASLSPGKRSPIIGSCKSPSGKRRGRPPKNLSSMKSQISKNLMSRFLQGQTIVKNFVNKESLPKKDAICNDSEKEERQGLLSLSWTKVRELLRAWLESGQTPLSCDVDLITEYMQEMVVTKNIDKLNILLNFLRRRTRELNCSEWTDVYKQVMGNVQNAMIAIYGKTLYVRD